MDKKTQLAKQILALRRQLATLEGHKAIKSPELKLLDLNRHSINESKR
jgi:hypothetical protein